MMQNPTSWKIIGLVSPEMARKVWVSFFIFLQKQTFLFIERMHDTVIIAFKRSRTTTFVLGVIQVLSSRSARGQPQLISSSMKAQCSHEPNFNQLSRETSRNLIQLRNSSAGMIS